MNNNHLPEGYTQQELFSCQKCGEEFSSGESDRNGRSPCCMKEGDPIGLMFYDAAGNIVNEDDLPPVEDTSATSKTEGGHADG